MKLPKHFKRKSKIHYIHLLDNYFLKRLEKCYESFNKTQNCCVCSIRSVKAFKFETNQKGSENHEKCLSLLRKFFMIVGIKNTLLNQYANFVMSNLKIAMKFEF